MGNRMHASINRAMAFASLALWITLAACGDGATPAIEPARESEFDLPGRYGVASFDRIFVDTSRSTRANGDFPGAPERTLPVRIWYPVDAENAGQTDAPIAASGPFPLVGYAHGFTSGKAAGGRLGEHLVSHGYVVIAPDFPLSNGGAPGGPTAGDIANQPADLGFVLQQLMRLDHPVARAIDPTKTGIVGLSLGGGTVVIGAYHPTLSLGFVGAAVALAPAACFTGPDFYTNPMPTMLIAGTADELVPFDESPERAFGWAPSPTTLVRLDGGTHVGMLGIDAPGINSDLTIGCAAVLGEVGEEDEDSFAGSAALLTEGLDGDVYRIDGCDLERFCKNGYVQTMSAERQLKLVRIATLAHFEATLRGRTDAAAFVSQSLDANNADTSVLTK